MPSAHLATRVVGAREAGIFSPDADKCPNNLRAARLIHLILPNSRSIDARRKPMSCGFNNLKQLFLSKSGSELTCSFDDIAHYYRLYLQLMRL